MTDKKGRKLSLVVGVFIFFLAPFFYLFSASFVYLLFIRFFHGLGITFYTTAFPAFVTDIVPEKRRGEILGHMAISTTLAFTFGPLVGVLVFRELGFTALIFTCVLTGILNLAVIIFIKEQYGENILHKKVKYLTVIFKRSVLVSSFIIIINAMIFGGVVTFLPLLLQGPRLNVGFYFMAESFAIILCRLAFAHLPDKYGRGPVFFYSFIIILFSVYLISRTDTLGLLIVAALSFGIGSALCTPALTAFMADEADPSARGTVFSFFYGAFDGGIIIAGVVLGHLADLTSLADMFFITSLIGAGCLIVFSLFVKKGFSQSLLWTLTGKNVP